MKETSYSVEEFGIKIERFFKKHKLKIIVLLVACIGYFIFSLVSEEIYKNKRDKANELYISLLENKDNSKLLELKQLNPNLYLAVLFNDKYIEELEKFEPSNEDELLLEIYKSRNLDSKIFLKDLQTIQTAFSFLKEHKIKEANALLNSITNNSAFYKTANYLKHYQENK